MNLELVKVRQYQNQDCRAVSAKPRTQNAAQCQGGKMVPGHSAATVMAQQCVEYQNMVQMAKLWQALAPTGSQVVRNRCKMILINLCYNLL